MPDGSPAGRSTLAREIADLRGLARSLQRHAPYAAAEIDPWFAACGEARDACAADALFRALRRRWLRASHDAAHEHLRSPCSDDATRLPSGAAVAFGYERELDPARLERKAASFAPAPQGWSGQQLIFSSGQAALSAVVLAASAAAEGRAVRVAHIGGYFETGELLELFAADVAAVSEDEPFGDADLLILEPVYLKQRFHSIGIARLAANFARHGCPRLIAVDATLCHLRFDMAALAAALPPGADCRLMRLSSLLKLDQAGFELANAGLLSVYGRGESEPGALAERLMKTRSTTGTGLSFADMCALDVPWLFDAKASGAYADAVFANNAALAEALAAIGVTVAHPVLDCDAAPWSIAPYCVVRLSDAAACRTAADALTEAAEQRGVLLQRGGSFGFRTHRFDVVEPEGEAPFLRFAMGASAAARDDAVALTVEVLGAAS